MHAQTFTHARVNTLTDSHIRKHVLDKDTCLCECMCVGIIKNIGHTTKLTKRSSSSLLPSLSLHFPLSSLSKFFSNNAFFLSPALCCSLARCLFVLLRTKSSCNFYSTHQTCTQTRTPYIYMFMNV